VTTRIAPAVVNTWKRLQALESLQPVNMNRHLRNINSGFLHTCDDNMTSTGTLMQPSGKGLQKKNGMPQSDP
jgi:hypothetical protein